MWRLHVLSVSAGFSLGSCIRGDLGTASVSASVRGQLGLGPATPSGE